MKGLSCKPADSQPPQMHVGVVLGGAKTQEEPLEIRPHQGEGGREGGALSHPGCGDLFLGSRKDENPRPLWLQRCGRGCWRGDDGGGQAPVLVRSLHAFSSGCCCFDPWMQSSASGRRRCVEWRPYCLTSVPARELPYWDRGTYPLTASAMRYPPRYPPSSVVRQWLP